MSAAEPFGLTERVSALEKAVSQLQQRLPEQGAAQRDTEAPGPDSGSSEGADLLQDEALEKLTHGLQKSAWDMAFLVGEQHFGTRVNFLIVVGVLANIALQAAFCFVLMDEHWVSMSDLTDSVEGAAKWRSHHGHAFANLDPVSGTSLTSRVCGGDSALHTSEAKEALSETVDSYYNKNGPVLTICVVVVYTMGVCSELNDVISFTAGIWGIPSGPSTSVSVRNGVARFKSVSSARRWAGTLMALGRTAVAVVLLYSGSLWLVKTVDIESLLLNCAALTFVLAIDESVYLCFSPAELDKFLDNLEPLPFQSSPVPRRRLRAWMALLLIAGSVTILGTHLYKVTGTLDLLKDALCGGNTDFVFGVDTLGAVLYTRTPAYDQGPQSRTKADIMAAREGVVHRIIKHNDTADPTGVSLWPQAQPLQRAELQVKLAAHTHELADARKECTDTRLENWGLGSTGNESVQSCADAASYCDEEPSAAIRLRCPRTCGCDSPLSGLTLRGVENGCPSACASSAHYRQVLDSLPCKDGKPEELSARPGWRRWFFNFRSSGDSSTAWSDETLAKLDCQGTINFLADMANNNGNYFPFHLCSRLGLSAFCPEACGCTNKATMHNFSRWGWGNLSGCPTNCVAV